MSDRNEFVDEAIATYVAAHSNKPDELVAELRTVTRERTGSSSIMQISDEQVVLFEILAAATGARTAIEIGTFTGTSSLAIARGMGPDGHLICLDVSDEWTSIARDFWQRAGVDSRIELRLGPALESLEALGDVAFDLAFIDADKVSYLAYYEAVIPKLRRGALLLADNTLGQGRVVDESDKAENAVAMRAFNDRVVNDPRVQMVLLPIADGLSVIEKL